MRKGRREGGGGRDGRRAYLRGASANGLIPFSGRRGLTLPTHVVGRIHQVTGTGATETGAAGAGEFEACFVAHLGRKGGGRREGGREERRGVS